MTCLSEGEVNCKDTKDEPLQRMVRNNGTMGLHESRAPFSDYIVLY